ncbi:response regulator transcription factor [Sphingomonas edaphi]|uniref:DNA-binding response regulator n=1 Tax=Sphingomonas edaphi TaxID=2315689 RepID=A0A418PYT5_9SPHN|nr:response regulator [Sphingomonas edaphi]RIX27132.1 DNA-binding response regulator [Sphingomonas edaphi]
MAEFIYRNIYVIDDDFDFSHSLVGLLQANAFEVRSFPLAKMFLDQLGSLVPGTILLDVKMPGVDGPALLDELGELNVDWPVVMMTGHGDIPLAVRCIQGGAIEFVEKPFSENQILAAISEAMLTLKKQMSAQEKLRNRAERLRSLSPREREVLRYLSTGQTNKQIAHALNISIRTVEMHRANLMRRLGVRTTPDVIRIGLEMDATSPTGLGGEA